MKNKFLAVLFGATLVLGACGGGDTDKDNGGDDNASAGINTKEAPVSVSACVSCHGGQFEGKGSNPSLQGIGSKLSEEEIHDIIVNGKGGMPPMMKGEDADKTAAWLAEQK